MKHFYLLVTCLLVASCATYQPLKPQVNFHPAINAQLGPLPEGLGIQLHFYDVNDKSFAKLDQLKPKLLRFDFLWEVTEPRKGVYDFTNHDKVLSQAARWDAWTIMILSYGNSHYPGSMPPTNDVATTAMINAVQTGVKRWKDRKVIYELWNEPDENDFWPNSSVDDYKAWSEKMIAAIYQVDSSACIIAPAMSGTHSSWMKVAKMKPFRSLSAITVHPYRSDPPETIIRDINRSRLEIEGIPGIISKNPLAIQTMAGLKPIAIGEFGYSLKKVDPETQAVYMARSWLG